MLGEESKFCLSMIRRCVKTFCIFLKTTRWWILYIKLPLYIRTTHAMCVIQAPCSVPLVMSLSVPVSHCLTWLIFIDNPAQDAIFQNCLGYPYALNIHINFILNLSLTLLRFFNLDGICFMDQFEVIDIFTIFQSMQMGLHINFQTFR